MSEQKKKSVLLPPNLKTHFFNKQTIKNYGKSVRDRFHYDARFV